MKGVTHISNNLTGNQVSNFTFSEIHEQRTVEDSRNEEDIGVLLMRLEHSENQPDENTGRHERIKIYIKNMVSIRCKMILKAVLNNIGLNYASVELGEVEIIGNISDQEREQLKSDLVKYGLELMEDKKMIIVEKIKQEIIEMIHYSDAHPSKTFKK